MRYLEKFFAALFFIGLCLFLLLRLKAHELWGDELQFWSIITHSKTISELWQNLRYEGHPIFAYVFVWLASKAYPDPDIMKIIHAFIGILNLLIIAYLSPFTRTQKALLLLGYGFSFEYFIISRTYSAGITFLLLSFWLARNYPHRILWRATLLGLAVCTNLMAALVAVVFFLDLLVDIYRKEARKLISGPAINACFIFISMSLLAYLTAMPAKDSIFVLSLAAELRPTHRTFWQSFLLVIQNSFIPIPSISQNYWSTSYMEQLYGISYFAAFTIVGAPLLLLLYFEKIKVHIFLLSLLVIVCFSHFQYGGYVRHHAHLFIAFLGYLWVGPFRFPERMRPESFAFVSYLFAIQVAASAYAHAQASFIPFSTIQKAADYLKERRLLENSTIIAYPAWPASLISAYIGPVFRPQSQDVGTFLKWTDDQRKNLSYSEIEELTKEKVGSGRRMILVSANSRLPLDLEDYPGHLKVLVNFPESAAFDNSLVIFELGQEDDQTTKKTSDH